MFGWKLFKQIIVIQSIIWNRFEHTVFMGALRKYIALSLGLEQLLGRYHIYSKRGLLELSSEGEITEGVLSEVQSQETETLQSLIGCSWNKMWITKRQRWGFRDTGTSLRTWIFFSCYVWKPLKNFKYGSEIYRFIL